MYLYNIYICIYDYVSCLFLLQFRSDLGFRTSSVQVKKRKRNFGFVSFQHCVYKHAILRCQSPLCRLQSNDWSPVTKRIWNSSGSSVCPYLALTCGKKCLCCERNHCLVKNLLASSCGFSWGEEVALKLGKQQFYHVPKYFLDNVFRNEF